MKNKYLYSNLVYSFCSVTYPCLLLIVVLVGSSNGGLESNIKCRFSEQNRTVFWTGEFVSGNIEFTNSDHKGLKLKSIDIELVGRLVYKYPFTDGRGGAKIRSYSTEFFNQRSTLNSSDARNSIILPYSNNTWPFRFFLNDSLPPTLDPIQRLDSHLYYYIRILFVRPEWYKRNIKQTIPVVVRHVSSPVVVKKVEAQGKNRKDVHLHVILQRSDVAVGNSVSIDVKIQNPKEVPIHRILVILVQDLKLGPAVDRKINLLSKTFTSVNEFKSTYLHEKFQFHVPYTTPPTFSFHPASNKQQPFNTSYELHFEAHLSGIFTNIRLQVPLTLCSYRGVHADPSHSFLFDTTSRAPVWDQYLYLISSPMLVYIILIRDHGYAL